MKPKLYYVRSKRGNFVHLARHITEHYRTLCGRRMPSNKGWRWARTHKAITLAQTMHVCARCRKKASR